MANTSTPGWELVQDAADAAGTTIDDEQSSYLTPQEALDQALAAD